MLAHKHGHARLALRYLARAAELAPADAEIRHDRGLAHLEAGEVGLAALAQREALQLDSSHVGARAQLAAALEAVGDDAGAVEALEELLRSIGPNLALQARLGSLRDAARTADRIRLLGAGVQRVQSSPLVGNALARRIGGDPIWRAPFAELAASLTGGAVQRLDLVFDSMDASLSRSDLSYGGTTEDDGGRRVPLDEFRAAGIVFLSQALGIDTLRARRILEFLLTPECGLGPHRLAGCEVGWTVQGGNGTRRYGLYAQLAP